MPEEGQGAGGGDVAAELMARINAQGGARKKGGGTAGALAGLTNAYKDGGTASADAAAAAARTAAGAADGKPTDAATVLAAASAAPAAPAPQPVSAAQRAQLAAEEEAFGAQTAALGAAAAGRGATGRADSRALKNILVGGKGGAVELLRSWQGDAQYAWRQYREHVPAEEGGGGFCGIFPTKIKATLAADREMVFCTTTNSVGRPFLAFCWECEEHHQIMATMYRKLHGMHQNFPVGPGGKHWEEGCGFQGANPMTDMNRTGGLYSALLMLGFVEKAPRIADATLKESKGALRPYHWGLRCTSLSVVTLSVFEKGKLTRICNQNDSIWMTLIEFFIGLFARAQQLWCAKESASEMEEWNPMKRDLQKWALASPNDVLKVARKAMAESKDQKWDDGKGGKKAGGGLALTDLKDKKDGEWVPQ